MHKPFFKSRAAAPPPAEPHGRSADFPEVPRWIRRSSFVARSRPDSPPRADEPLPAAPGPRRPGRPRARRGRRRRRPDGGAGAGGQRRAAPRVITREAAVLCGRPWVDEVFRQLDPSRARRLGRRRRREVSPGQRLCRLEGPARSLLTGERTALNFLQTLSGTATATRRYVAAVAGLPCRILDTRKTLPGLRTRAEIRGALRRRQQPPHGPLRRHPGQGEPHHGRGLDRARPSPPPGPPAHACRSRSRSRRSTSCARRSTPAPTWPCSMSSASTTCARRWR